MNKDNVCRAIGECHEMIYNGNKHNNKSMITSGAFGLEIIGIMLSEPVEMPDIHVIKIDVEEIKSTKTDRGNKTVCKECGTKFEAELKAGLEG